MSAIGIGHKTSQDGGAQLFTIFFLFLTAAIAFFLMTELFMSFHRQKARLRFDYCVLEYMNFHRQEVNKFQQTNSIIEKLYFSEQLLKLTPVTASAAQAAKVSRMILEKQQLLTYISFLKKSYQSPIKECQSVTIALKPVYQLMTLDLKRSLTRFAILRRTDWTITFIQKNMWTKIKVQTPDSKSKINFTKEIFVGLNKDLILSN